MSDVPFISAEKNVRELTVRVILLAILLTVLLAMANAYLALKLGILTSASIPAAIISMGILRFFKNSTILENNAVQTAASAGEAVAGGIVYTIPALIIIGFWQHFSYWTNVLIALCGGILGVLFSIPLRRILVNDPSLKFPEGRAIAEVLKSSTEKIGLKDILLGGIVGSLLELLQSGFKVLVSSWSHWLIVRKSLFGLGAGFSATMIGAGYLIGQDMAISIFLGAIISWLFALPLISHLYPHLMQDYPVDQAASFLWNDHLRYVGIGAMLFAGLLTFIRLIKPLAQNIWASWCLYKSRKNNPQDILRTDKDLNLSFIIFGIGGTTMILAVLLYSLFPTHEFHINRVNELSIIIFGVLYVLIIGFLFSIITAYFSGMVGVTASPGSSVVIAGMLFAAWLLLMILNHLIPLPLTTQQIQAAEAITIIIGSVVTGIAAIANDNSQDLKVGQLVGATPWKQELMLLLGVIVSALVIPPVMQILFDVYGIAGVMPRPGMDLSQSLPAPTAALMAAITEAVFRNTLPWDMMALGASIILIAMVLNYCFKLHRLIQLSWLGIAIGMYLPLSSSFPLLLGGILAYTIERRLKAKEKSKEKKQRGILIACGLVAGSAVMDVLLAIPFSMFHNLMYYGF